MRNEIMLAKIYGEMSAFVCLPLNKALGRAVSGNHAGWLAAYAKSGLSFSNCREEVECMRRLVSEGLLATRGSTQGKVHSMTVDGVRSAMAGGGETWASAGKLLKGIIRTQVEGGTVSPYGHHRGARIVMAWDLIPCAGEWLETALATDHGWAAYKKKLCRLQQAIAPLLILGYANLFHDGEGYVWGVMPTAAGKAAAEQWPEELPPMEDDDLFDAWKSGYDNRDKYLKAPPQEYANVCAVTLPGSAWL